MRKPIILVTMSYDNKEKPWYPRISTTTAYIDAIVQAGGTPICCPYCEAAQLALLADGLLLTGGADIAPSYYGEQILGDTVELTKLRDDYEWELLGHYLPTGKPILGICRGFQLLSTFCGGTMYQDLPTQLGRDHGDTTHEVVAEAGWWLEQYGERFTVNSHHHQAVKVLGSGLIPTVHATDGTLEAFENADGSWQACQWHPELAVSTDEGTLSMLPLFRQFVERCRTI